MHKGASKSRSSGWDTFLVSHKQFRLMPLSTSCVPAEDLLTSFHLTDNDLKHFKKVFDTFETHYIGQKNVIYERAKFYSRFQEDGEPVDRFITSLHALAATCEFGGLKEELIRDRIIVGIRNKTLSERLQLESSLTLEQAELKVRQSEQVKQQQATVHCGSTLSPVKEKQEVDALRYHAKGKPKRHNPAAGQKPASGRQDDFCTYCGLPPHQRTACPAKNDFCNKCQHRATGKKCADPRVPKNINQGDVQRLVKFISKPSNHPNTWGR